VGNGISLSITHYPSNPKRPWKVDIPASVAGRRIRRFFPSRQRAQEFVGDYKEALLSGGVDLTSDTMTVSKGLKLYNAAKFPKVGPRHEEGLRFYGVRIERTLGKLRISMLKVRDVERFLDQPTWGPRTRWNALG
jgi:hypothetical protein